MKILFCSAFPLRKELGAAKVLMELADELRLLGWTCDVARPSDMGHPDEGEKYLPYARALQQFLKRRAGDYDIVEYEHGHLPFPRTDFSATTLMVARSQLLAHHFLNVPIPRLFREHLRAWRHGTTPRRDSARNRDRAQVTVEQADLIMLSNQEDRRALLQAGIPQEKMVVLPLGLTRERFAQFDAVHPNPVSPPVIAFVGTFDSRKGSRDFPEIIQALVRQIPEARFRFLGTGQGRPKEYVERFFPRALRRHLEVVAQFPAEELPDRLADCSIGVFPSYVESFGFGVLEMLTASLPVFAYDSPGPTMLLSGDYLVPAGHRSELVAKMVRLLQSPEALAKARTWAKQRAHEFTWDDTARRTRDIYTERLARLRGKTA